jgi:ABC-type multidrug transport system fused ATPase/permease subunit
MNLYLRLLQFVKPYWPRLAGAMGCMMCVSAASAASAFLVKPVLDDVFFKKDLTMLKLILNIGAIRGARRTGTMSFQGGDHHRSRAFTTTSGPACLFHQKPTVLSQS